MANYTSTSGSYTTTLTVTQTSQNTANNTSTLTYSLTLTKNAGSGLWNNNSCPWSITIDGTQVASGTFTYDFRNYSSLTLKSSTTTTVNHNSDGTKTVSVSASVNMNNSDYVSVMQPSGSLTLTTIPRASDVSVSNYSIANTSGSISATITSKASFYHRWRWRMNSGSWSSWTNKGLIASTSSTVTVANTTLLAQLPSATSGSFNIEVATYSDSGYATLVGTKSASATVSVNTSNIKPSVSLGNIGLNSTPIANYAVAGYSKVQSAWTTTNSSGASSVTTYFTTSHGSLATTSSTSTSGTTVSGTIPSSSANYTLTISAYAKDSRGATSSTVSKSITVYGYTPPTATLNAYRVASSSSTTEDGAGTYAYVTFSGAVSASVNGQNSVQVISCSYWGSISGQATNGGHYALADTQTVTFQLTVTDKVTSSTATKTISTASYPLDLYDNGGGSVGVGFGAVANGGWLTSGLKNDLSRGNKTRVGIQTAYESTNSTSGTGFMIIATIKPKGAYDNKAITFKILRRGIKHPSNVSIRFDGANSTDPGLASFVADFNSTDFFLYKSATSTWQLISYKTNYDQISILALYADDYVLSLNDIDTTQSVISAVPDGAVQATEWSYLHAQFATNADSATTATTAGTANDTYRNIVSRIGNNYNSDFTGDRMRVYEYTSEAPNGPSAHYYHVFNIMGPDTSYATQLAIGMTTQRIYYRTYQGGNWLTWWRAELFNTIWTGTLKGGNAITLDVSSYSRLRVYANCYAVTIVYTVELTRAVPHTQISGYTYSGGGVSAEYTASGGLELITSQSLVSSDKKTFYHYHCGYQAGSSTTNKDNDSNYFVYQIDGLAY